MRSSSWSRRARPALVAAAAATVVTPLGLASASAPAAVTTSGPTDLYIVQVAGNPLATNPATKPATGRKVDTKSAKARSYRAALSKKHGQLLGAVRAGKAVTDYGVAFNGFAARLTESQADALEKRSDVVRVWKNEIRHQTTNRTPDFLGMAGQAGVWQSRFGGPKNAGAGMIIGVIDSGIWPENPSFAPLKNTTDDATIAAKWNGVCDGGTGPNKVVCNNKIIGARAYWASAKVQPFEYLNPRGYNSHGTHTASTAAGNFGVKAANGSMDLGTISGMAPAARIAVYKALWSTADGSGGNGGTVDLVAAIDQAVADGVDVINYSISGSQTSVVSPDEVAFFNAARAGVFVAASAGNSGDTVGVSSVAHNSPWVTTVAASTVDKPVAKTVTTGDGVAHEGVGIGSTVGPAKLVDSTAIAAAGVKPADAQMCLSDVDPATPGAHPALDAAKAKGAIVLCTRGNNARVDKSLAVKNAGGIGMVLVNTSDAQSLNADIHEVPTVHLNATEAAKVKAYLASAGDAATATIGATSTTPVRAPEMAGFSSFGPALAGDGDLLKPDITAPGVDIIAAVSPMGPENGKNFDAMSGTSMSAPHIAGIAALIKSKNPSWSPMAVKSAMMTTASQLDNTGAPIQRSGETATPLDMGAGHVVPKSAFTPGLVYDSTPVDWARYACGINQLQTIDPTICDEVGSIDPSNLNYPSIAIGSLAGTQTVTRTVTNVSGRPMTYTARVQQPTGVKVAVSPSKITVPAGKSRSFTVTLTRTAAPFDRYAFGALTWQGKNGSTVRSPIAVRPVAVDVPAEVIGTGTSGTKTVRLGAGFDGTLSADVNGLVPATVSSASTPVGQDAVTKVVVPAGTKAVRFATYDEDYAPSTDLDMSVVKDGKEIGKSAGATAAESVTFTDPEPGTYEVVVSNFAAPGAVDVKTNSFVVDPGAKGNLAVDPSVGEATLGESYPVTLSWSKLDASKRYLGTVGVMASGQRVGSTLVTVNP